MVTKVKEIKNFVENGKKKTKLIFNDSQYDKEIIFEGKGQIKIAVPEI